jgi:16S rRNA (guanine527-N7)-methyltransferase
LSKVTLHYERVEKFQPTTRFDCITARAFTSLAELYDRTQHLLAPGGQLLAMKGQYPHEEIADLPKSVTVAAVIPLQIPELAASRHLVCLRNTTADGALTHG